MLPIAAPTIAAPAVAPAAPVLVEGVLPGNTPAGTPTPEAAAQTVGDPSIFALLLAPSAVTELAIPPTGDAAIQADTGLAQLLSAFLGDAAEPSEDAAKEGELLALLASFGAAAAPTPLAPDAAGFQIDDVLGESLIASPTGPMPAASVDPFAPAIPAISAPSPVSPASELASVEAAPVAPTTKLPASLPAETMAMPPAPGKGQHVAPVVEQPTATSPLPVTMPVMATEVAAAAAQTAAAVPAAPSLATAAAGAVADVSRKPPSPSSARAQSQPQTTIGAVPVADVAPGPVTEALQTMEPVVQTAATAELPKPQAVQAVQAVPLVTDEGPVATPAPDVPVMGMPAAAPPVASALPAAAPLPTPAQTPVASTLPEAKSDVAEALPAAPLAAAPAATVVAGDASSQAIAAAPRAEPFAAVLRSEAAQPATGRTEPNPLERAVAHQVSRAIVQHLPDGGARMVMRLTPPELGTVRIEFISRDGMVTARLMAEDEGVRQALDRALPHIRADVRSDHPSVDISVDRSDQRQAWGEGHARQERRDEPRTGQGRRRRDDEPLFSVDGVEPAVGPTPVRAAQQLGGRVGPTLVDALA